MEAEPLLPGGVDAELVRRSLLLYNFVQALIIGSFASVRETYTEQVLRTSDAVATGTYAVVAYFLFHALSNPIAGKLSDAVGRRPIMLIGVATLAIVFGILAVIANVYLFVGLFAVLGVFDCGTSMLYIMLVDTSNRPLSPGVIGWAARAAGVTETTDDELVEQRVGLLFSFAWGVGLFGSISGVGSAVLLSSALGVRLTIGMGSVLALLLFLRLSATLPETVGDNPVVASSGPLMSLLSEAINEQRTGAELLFRTPRRRSLVFASFLQHGSASATFSLVAYWVVFKFGFGIGMQAACTAVAVVAVACGVALLQLRLLPMAKEHSTSEVASALFILAVLPFWAVLALAVHPWMALVGLAGVAVNAVFPQIRALLSADVAKMHQGFVQGALSSINSIANIMGVISATFCFEYTTDDDVSHDSHHANISIKANSIWVAIILLELAVAAILLHTPQPDFRIDMK